MTMIPAGKQRGMGTEFPYWARSPHIPLREGGSLGMCLHAHVCACWVTCSPRPVKPHCPWESLSTSTTSPFLWQGKWLKPECSGGLACGIPVVHFLRCSITNLGVHWTCSSFHHFEISAQAICSWNTFSGTKMLLHEVQGHSCPEQGQGHMGQAPISPPGACLTFP